MPGLIAGRSIKDCAPKAKQLLDRLNIAARAEHKPGQLSGGEQQRVAVARALFNDPSVVLADEPSGNLDSAHAKELHQLFFDLRSEFGQTFVIVTHNEELAEMADRRLVMKDGVI
jgi:lipoprotein-releasing system ATP-binding protein